MITVRTSPAYVNRVRQDWTANGGVYGDGGVYALVPSNDPFAQLGPTLDLTFAGNPTDLLAASTTAGYTLDTYFTPETYQIAVPYAVWGANGLEQKNFADIVTFTRASTGTYFNSAGTLTTAAIDVPRFDYNPSALAAQGLLIEESRTNGLRYTEAFMTQALTVTGVSGTFSNGETVTATGGGTGTYISADSTATVYAIFNGTGTFSGTLTGGTSGATATISTSTSQHTVTRATITANATTAPTGATTADKLVEDTTASNTHFMSTMATAVTSGLTVALSVFVKAAERTWALVNSGGTPLGTNGVYVDLSAGALGSTVGTLAATPTIQNCGNGWYRVTIAVTPASTGNGLLQVRLATADGTTSYTGDGTSGIFVWGAQLEASATVSQTFSTSYIPTTTTALTRSADVANINTLSPWFNSTAGTVYAEFLAGVSVATQQSVFDIENSADVINNRISWRMGNEFVASSGSTVVNFFITPTASATSKWAFAFTTDDFAFSRNGGAPSTDTSGALPVGLDRMRLGGSNTAPTFLNGYLRRITYYPRRLANADLQAITA